MTRWLRTGSVLPSTVIVLAGISGCTRGSGQLPAPTPAATTSPAAVLSVDVPGFTAGPLVERDGFVRRDFARGGARIDVTIASFGAGEDAWAGWLKMSSAYPQAPLDVPAATGNGFFDCKGAGDAERCELHIQLRAGHHVEVMSGGTATRADLMALMSGLRLGALARRSSE